ncbi:unnamed protein product [Bursaphelenchus xylophilus]|uniref:Actin maturation protease n=1 Tax=Bursaphelenchus xylophilus TaxID=6326 RepID=A0A1I7RN75_BURXY|nr:unnamed protein product [Bursaphelenchus xylophilus]CAG9123722.1 unnamed protein product [Bursaphelenchus xylophilus]
MELFGTLFSHRLSSIRETDSEEVAHGVLRCAEPVKFDLQKGPTCGPVAQVILSKLFATSEISVEEIVEYNRSKSYTTVGECFSVDWMRESCAHFFPELSSLSESFPTSIGLVRNLKDEALYLVPYDSGKDHGPVSQNGVSAHWCIIIGYFIITNQIDDEILKFREEDLYLVTYQGKSRNPGLWKYTALRASNAQLNTYDKQDMAMDIGGIQAGLKGRVVRIQGGQGHRMKIVNFRM